MNEHTRRVRDWLIDHDDVQRWVLGQPERHLRAWALRTMAENAPEQLPDVDFAAVDWEAVVRDVLGD